MKHPDVSIVTDHNLDDTLARDGVLLLDFDATWCPPCRAMEPHVGALAERWRGRARVAACNVDENPEAAIRFGVQSVPTFLVIRRGVVLDRVVGAVPRSRLDQAIARAVG